MNFLEQLAAEWYEFSGYFVRTNVRARKRAKGGWDKELDVLAYDPSGMSLIHVETSADSLPWAARRERFLTKKFDLSENEYREILGAEVRSIRKVAIVGFSKTTKADLNWRDDIEVKLASSFIREIAGAIRRQHPITLKGAIPEGFPILRAFQAVLDFGSE